ncbi:agmatinase [Granulosicoccus antarcticus]|uniref:Guanidinopropionase n=1 Tax=Granulosicoccus antarcticus IMCC3135 TaxID=1192854 RepID=A0A2Z2NW38_9GAMM|nr:agmatinase [Granulosicoccus antarcticus]ASJ74725.1 Guanidinopropionase [Granulosicoccus antarcticus IMCC3135]
MTAKEILYTPIPSAEIPRYAGLSTFMRLPHLPPNEAMNVDIGLIGVPWDGGTTNRPGARHGPRQVRELSSLMRNYHPALKLSPYKLANCLDLGDTPVNPLSIEETLHLIETFYHDVVGRRIAPLSVGGDHLISLPILRALAHRHGSLGMVQFDAHTDTWDTYFGDYKYSHGTPFRRAIEEGVLDPKRTVQIGIRGGVYDEHDGDWGLEQGIRVITIEEYNDLGPDAVAAEARRIVGHQPTYVTFDVDALDPVYTPGTGTPEIGGLNTFDCQKMLRALRGLNLIGGDVVEVSPPFDPSGNTALVGATMMFEILCILAEALSQNQ